MVTPSHLRSFQALELAIRTGSLTLAADRLSITPAAVGQRIKTLEEYLGLELVVRSRSGIRPTRELASAMPHIFAAFKELETATDVLDFQRLQEIHIVADQDFAELWLKPRLPRFKAEYPNILFCINGIGDIPLRLGQADCEIWFGESRGKENEDQLFQDYVLPITTVANAGRLSTRAKHENLEGFPLLHLECYEQDAKAMTWPRWTSQFGYRKTATSRGIKYKHVFHALESIYYDAGFLICGAALVLEQLESGKLQTPFPKSEGSYTGYSYNIAFHAESMKRNQIRQFRNWLLEESASTKDQILRFIKAD